MELFPYGRIFKSICLTIPFIDGVIGAFKGNWKIQNEYMYLVFSYLIVIIFHYYTVLQWTEANNSYLLSLYIVVVYFGD